MARSKEETVKDLAPNYSKPKRQAQEEEIAVKQTIQKLAQKLSEPQDACSMLDSVPVEMIDNIAKKGQLTLVAEELDDSFLRSIEAQNNTPLSAMKRSKLKKTRFLLFNWN
ncbi:hypothetical protein BN59_00071 [Legionella massiliensis]|uniref:Uncharacterized protein n=1 Tax=Legionella massiliensis TaxID=1034943 RepID=A0A078KS65_9GAMM|nr:hypothetical protein [Legionella massiliensis]CDZ75812.1 hypothetical protein BN59_00071 [Legionella massiliensis]CEE11550.1 hypothetical protein BN1094_00071 [Legionella massiliensis]